MLRKRKVTSIRVLICFNTAIVVFGLILLTTSNAILQVEETYGESFLSDKHQLDKHQLVNDIYLSPQWHTDKVIKSHSEYLAADLMTDVPATASSEKVPAANAIRIEDKHGKALGRKGALPVRQLLIKRKFSQLSRHKGVGKVSSIPRSLRGSSKEQKSRMKVHKMTTTKRTSTRKHNDEPAFHVDYSGPRTHPPRNN